MCGIKDINPTWFHSYLTEYNIFQLPITLKHTKNICCRLPQGSILGPLLFLLYGNDRHSLSVLDPVMFADNTNLFYEYKDFVLFSPRPTDDPIKSPLSVCPYVCPSFSSAFFSEMAQQLVLIYGTMVDNWNILKLAEPFFPGKFIFARIWAKRNQNGPKTGGGGGDFLKNNVIFFSLK